MTVVFVPCNVMVNANAKVHAVFPATAVRRAEVGVVGLMGGGSGCRWTQVVLLLPEPLPLGWVWLRVLNLLLVVVLL